jgi:hypothetical protein
MSTRSNKPVDQQILDLYKFTVEGLRELDRRVTKLENQAQSGAGKRKSKNLACKKRLQRSSVKSSD